MSDLLWLSRSDLIGEKLVLDTNAKGIDFGFPSRDVEAQRIIGADGSRYTNFSTYGNREFSYKYRFRQSGTTALSTDRITFIQKWIDVPDSVTMLLNWLIGSDTYQIQVRPIMGSENYQKYIISDTFDIRLISESAYFEKSTDTTSSHSVVGTTINQFTIINSGLKTPFIFEFTPDYDFAYLEVFDGYDRGFTASGLFLAGQLISIDMSNAVCEINGVEIAGFFSSGSPFFLEGGSNGLNIIATDGDLDIVYKVRIL